MLYQVSAENGREQRRDGRRVANVVRGVGWRVDCAAGNARPDAGLSSVPVEIAEGFIALKACDGKPYLRAAARRAITRRGREEPGCYGRNDKLWKLNDQKSYGSPK